jgi:hypothetical protein
VIDQLVKRARLQRVSNRASDLDNLRDMLDGSFVPANGDFLPVFQLGSSRHAAFLRAVKIVSPTVPVFIGKGLAGLDFGNTTWSDAESNGDQVNDLLKAQNLPKLARDLATEYRLTGACAAMASTPTIDGSAGEPTITVLKGVNIPYPDIRDPNRITAWYRAIQFVDETQRGQLRWWVEVYEFTGDTTIHRVWHSLDEPTDLGMSPDDEFTSIARPRFALYGLQPDGLPQSPVLSNLGRVLGLYATELRLATSEELAAVPMLLTKGEADVEQVGPAEVIAVDADGDASWLDPGSLGELREQVFLKRDALREAFNLPGGSLGGQTPSGEALSEANRGFMQETRSTADAVSGVLTEVVHDFLALHNLPPVDVQVPIDRAYTTASLLEVVEKGVDLGAVPDSVAARMFQQFLGSAYSDEELEEFLEEKRERRDSGIAGMLARADNPVIDEDGDEAAADG